MKKPVKQKSTKSAKTVAVKPIAKPAPKRKAKAVAVKPIAKPAPKRKVKLIAVKATVKPVPKQKAKSAGAKNIKPLRKKFVKSGVKAQFPIVGIGSSAGGLEALEQFLSHVPRKCGMAFVIVQHLDPNHKGIMVELLQRSTEIPVVHIRDRMKVEPDHVYVIPPNCDLSILQGVLYLLEPAAIRGLRLPIDYFLRSLAEDQHERAIAVILSGMGSDGTLGLRTIKEQAGAVFVQALDSAKFEGMPRSAIDSGLVDVIAPAEELAVKIIEYFHHVPLLSVGPALDFEDKNRSGLEKVVLLLRTHTGHDFSLYKKSTIYRRIERRMGLHQLQKISDYVRFLRENPHEAKLLFNELLIGVTSFFRDPLVWEQLKTEVIPSLMAANPGGGLLRAWTPGCSTGEEAYSLAIAFKEVLDGQKTPANFSLQIFATDLDNDAIDKARIGVYPVNISADVSESRLRRFFVKDDSGYRMSKEIREMLIFAPQNLIMDPPFTNLDLITCRNMLIYFELEMQKRILPLFHYCLNPGGILLLGSAETIGSFTELFSPLSGKTRFYRRKESDLRPDQIVFPTSFVRSRTEVLDSSVLPKLQSAHNLSDLTDRLLLLHFSPPGVLTNNTGDILYTSGKTGKYLEPAVGKANLNIFAMAREGLSYVLNKAFQKAIRQKTIVMLKNVRVGTNGGTKGVDVTIQPLSDPAELRGMVLIVFNENFERSDVQAAGKAGKATVAEGSQLADLTVELQESREELQTTREEMQTSQEELKSANEELQSTNEELQSTNEELTTSKEEMQSMNEELQTVNHELQAKVDESSRTSDDMKNLLNSTEIATLFLDNDLKIRRFTEKSTDIIKLIIGDTGRPITDLSSVLDYPELGDDARGVLRSLVFKERQVSASKGRWFRVRIMPYRTHDNRINGVVITFVNISESKGLELTMRDALSVLQGRFDTQSDELDVSQKLEGTLNKAQKDLQGRFDTQSDELDVSQKLERTLNKAQKILEQRLKNQVEELRISKKK